MPAIFLSYRRNDTADRVSRIYHWLIDHGVPQEDVFFDTSLNSIPARTEFPEKIKAAATTADCVLVIIGPRWLTYRASDLDEQPRLWHPEDWVRKEVEIALSKPGRTFPILLDQTSMPQCNELPPSLEKLAIVHGARLRRGEADFEADMLTIAEQMAGALTHALRWNAEHRQFIAIQGERLAYLQALEARYSVLDLPVASNIRLSASEIYRPLRLRKDPLRPADRRHNDTRRGNRLYSRHERDDTWDEDDGYLAPIAHEQPTITRAESPDQALKLSSTHRLVVLGGPGSGKTTLLGQLTLEAAQRARKDPTVPLPVLLSLPALARSGQWTVAALPDFIASTLDGMNKSLPPDTQAPRTIAPALAEHILHGRAFLCLDGLDEVTPTLRRQILGWLGTLPAPMGANYIVIGSRFTDYREGDLPREQYTEWELESLTSESCKALVHALMPKLEKAIYPVGSTPQLINAERLLEQLRKGPAIGWWGDSPLLLTLATFVFVKRKGMLLPRRVEVYDEVITSLLEDRLRRDETYTEYRLYNTYDLMALVALDLFTSIGQVFTVRQIADLTRSACAELHMAGEDDIDRMYLRLINSGLIEPQASDTFKFRHPTFQEYLAGAGLAARLIKNDEQAWNLLEEKSIMSRWLEPLAFMAGILVMKHGMKGEHIATEWISKLASQQSAPDGDPGYLALVQALHALRDTAGFASPPILALREGCIAAWANALTEAARHEQKAFTKRLLALVDDIEYIVALEGASS